MLMEKEEDITMKKTYKIEVDCAACALKMEDAAKKVEGVTDATVSFMTQRTIARFIYRMNSGRRADTLFTGRLDNFVGK